MTTHVMDWVKDTELVTIPAWPAPHPDRWYGAHSFDSTFSDVRVALQVVDSAHKIKGNSLEARLTFENKCLATLLPGGSLDQFKEELISLSVKGRYTVYFYKQ